MSIRALYEKLGIVVEEHGNLILLLAVGALLIALLGAQSIHFATGTDTFVDENSRIYQDYDHLFLEKFHTENIVLIVSSDDVTQPEVLKALDALERDVREIRNVRSVTGVVDYLKNANALLTGRHSVPEGDVNELLSFIPDEVLNAILPSEQTALILVEIPGDLTNDEKEELVTDIKHTIRFAHLPPSTTITLTGDPAFHIDLSAQMSRSTGELLVLAALLMVVVLSIVFRYVRWYLLSLLMVLIGVVYTFGAMGITGVPMTMASMSIFPILIGLGIDYAIQFHNRIEEELARQENHKEAIYHTVGNVGPAVLIALTITILGFAALLTSDVPMIRDFGILGIMGVVLCYLTSMFVGVTVIYKLDARWVKRRMRQLREPPEQARRLIREELQKRAKASKWSTKLERALTRVTMETASRPLAVLSIALLLGCMGVYYDEHVEVQTDVQKYVPQDLKSLLDLKKMQSLMGGRQDELNLIVKGDVLDPTTLRWMYEFGEHEVQSQPNIHAAESIATLLASQNGGTLPSTKSEAERLADALPENVRNSYLSGELYAVINFNIGDAYKELGLPKLKTLSAQIEKDMAWMPPPPDVEATLTGNMYVFTVVLDALTSGRMEMTILGLVMIFLALLLIYRDWMKALVPVVPMIVVTGWSGGLMYIAGIPYTPLTGTMGALILGIGGEYTVLMMERYFEEREKGLAPFEALSETSVKIGRAILASGLTVLCGFSALIASPFPLQSNFGFVTVMDMVFVILATFIVFPPLIVTLDRMRTGEGPILRRMKEAMHA
ncbi:efflux RND transporter permease subunit [Methermicoccus shengliensis]|uniref:efflux RND transporter permease subunit n=1 Tax=Methermicoccus shengliensis TaxID=660064 RepID=UPI000693711F|nr:RND family transporter [Methermicoccus shengliensis]